MKIKFLCVALATTLFTSGLFAQNTTFGIRAGVNFQNLNGRDFNDDKLENKLLTGFNVGVNAEIPVGIDFYLQPGILLSTKGAQLEDSKDKVSLSYVEVPINFLYKPAIGTGRLLLGFGPYAAFGVGGKYKFENGDDDADIDFKSEVTPAEYLTGYYVKRFDAGANFLFGYEMSNKLSFQLNAGLGLLNISPDIEGVDDNNTSVKNTGFGLSLGYRF